MARNPHGVLLTYEDYAQLPNDRNRYEILDGVLSVTPAPSTFHQDAVTNLTAILRDHVRRKRLGKVIVAPCDVLLSEHNIVQPDLLFVAQARRAIIEPANVKGAPDLVVEVLSPSTALTDLNAKRQIYAEHGVASYWIVDPVRRLITAYILSGEVYEPIAEASADAHFSAPPFPELSIDLAEVWE